jgi:hypothetical protein
MADTITKILFRRGLDVQRRTAGGDGIKFNVGEPAFCLDTNRFYIGTGTDSAGLVGGAPIGIKNHGVFSNLFGSGPGGFYNSSVYNTLTSKGIDTGDILFDNSNTVMYYVSSKNAYTATPSASEIVRFNLLSRTTGTNGISAVKALELAQVALDPTFFTVNVSDGIKLKYDTSIVGKKLVVDDLINGNNGLTISGPVNFNNPSSVLNVVGNIVSNGIIYASNPAGVGYNSNDWQSSFSTVRTTSASWTTAANVFGSYLPFAWAYNTTTNIISTIGTSYKVGINTLPAFAGLTIKGTSTLATALSVYGSIQATGDVVVYSTSDIKFKKNVTPLQHSLNKVLQLNGVRFDWDCNHKKGHDVGVIAQEIEKVLPEAVIDRGGEDGKAVNYEKIIPLLIEAIKELAKR